MKIKDFGLIILPLLLIVGIILYYEKKPAANELPSDYVWIKMDPSSSRTYTTILMPKLNEMCGQIEEIKVQNQWLRRRLDKCLEKLEAERGLEPMLPERDLPLVSAPNLAGKYFQDSEPWFAPYEEPNVPSVLEDPDTMVKQLVCIMGIKNASNRVYLDFSVSRIKNFEKRLKRLESYMEK